MAGGVSRRVQGGDFVGEVDVGLDQIEKSGVLERLDEVVDELHGELRLDLWPHELIPVGLMDHVPGPGEDQRPLLVSHVEVPSDVVGVQVSEYDAGYLVWTDTVVAELIQKGAVAIGVRSERGFDGADSGVYQDDRTRSADQVAADIATPDVVTAEG